MRYFHPVVYLLLTLTAFTGLVYIGDVRDYFNPYVPGEGRGPWGNFIIISMILTWGFIYLMSVLVLLRSIPSKKREFKLTGLTTWDVTSRFGFTEHFDIDPKHGTYEFSVGTKCFWINVENTTFMHNVEAGAVYSCVPAFYSDLNDVPAHSTDDMIRVDISTAGHVTATFVNGDMRVLGTPMFDVSAAYDKK